MSKCEVIAIYSVKYSDNVESAGPIIYLNERNISNIKKVFLGYEFH